MADFDLSLVATFDTQQAEAGGQRVEATIDRVAAAEKRADATTRQSKATIESTAKAERERAAAIDAVRSAIEPGYAAQQRMNALLEQAKRLAGENAISLKQLEQVERLHAQAMNGGAASAGQARAAYTQLGFQIQDITQTLAMGINPMVVFGQQAGQTAAAVAGMGGKLGAVGTFLSGPWGSIILGAVTVVGLFATSLFEADEGAEELGDSTRSLAEKLDLATNSFAEVLAASREYNNEQARGVQLALASAQAAATVARENLEAAIAIRQRIKANLDLYQSEVRRGPTGPGGAGQIGALAGARLFGDGLSQQDEAIRTLRATRDATRVELAGVRGRLASDPNFAIAEKYKGLRAEAAKTITDVDKLADRFKQLNLAEQRETAATRQSTRERKESRGAIDRQRAALEKFGDKTGERIKRITEQFDAQPKLIDQAAKAARELDAIIEELSDRKPAGFAEMIDAARDAKGVIADSLLRPFEELERASERRLQIDRLILQGREDEAEALETIWRLEERLGPLSRERKADILDTVRAEREVTEELERRRALQEAYLDITRSVRGEVEAILSGTGKLSNLKGLFQQLKGKVLAEQLFGDVFRDLDKYVKQETGIKDSVDILAGETERAGTAAGELADTFDEVSRQLRNTAAGTATAPGAPSAELDAFLAAFDKEFGKPKDGAATGPDDAEIIVTAVKSGVNGLTPERYFDEMTKRLVKPLLDGLDAIFGTEFFGKFQGVLSGAAGGYLTGGIPGGILGGLKGVTDTLGKGLKGAQTGTMVSGIGKALGIGMSTTGSQIGGALGSFLPIPGGDIIGSIAGGLFGKLIGGSRRGSAIITGADSALGTYGNSSSRKDAALGLGGGVQEGIRNIAKALDAELGAFKVSIGVRDDNFRVDTQGRGYTKSSLAGVRDFGNDEAGAIAFAISDAIADGAIKGISPAVERALKSSSDIEKAVAEAVKVQDLEQKLRFMGDAFAEAMEDFAKVAADRVELARKYGLDLVKVEELNGKERKQLVDDALARQVGSLKRLVEDLTFGNLFEGTASERRQKLLGEVEDAKEDVSAGVAGATDRLAELQRQLVETSRAAFGTAGGEYAADRTQALSSAQAIIAAEQKRIEEAAAATQQQIGLANETNELLSGVNGRLDTLIGKVGAGSGGGVTYSPAFGGGADFGSIRNNLVAY